jgi:hypothetical protein
VLRQNHRQEAEWWFPGALGKWERMENDYLIDTEFQLSNKKRVMVMDN